ncbi:MAG: SpoIIE family protein phosphatase [Aeromicrobium sp.]|uniref:SpoIIE family protein phosphatase n=1 Tax=Aeromicrobium sp. TaxID=1871063 RepID=UPI0026258352|nr:SpoIIE family protein phosphatase [Aeromicrobium sp.]MDF1706184.1 SpoIIE family protein phosphatase [Aeromicrobium sp.]
MSLPLSDHTPAYETASLSTCDREPIHVPGAIQPHGLLLALDVEERVEIVSANAPEMLGRTVAEVRGELLHDVIGREAAAAVRQAVADDHLFAAQRVRVTGPGLLGRSPVDLVVHHSGDRVVVELEPVGGAGQVVSYRTARTAVSRLTQTRSLTELCDQLAAEIRSLTGFDRVMVYRFDAQWNGEVVAEDKRPDLNSFHGLHYPATDIPAQARRLYTVNWTRLIADIGYTPVALDPVLDAATGQPLDLSHSTLRSVSPIHIEYLSNMGVTASMSVSMISDGELWGLVACHHYSGSHHVSFDVRSAAEFLGQAGSQLIDDRQRADHRLDQLRATTQLAELVARIGADPGPVHDALIADPATLDLTGATGAAVWVGGRLLTAGRVPDADALHRIAELLRSDHGEAVSSDHLAGLDPELAAHSATAAGALVISNSADRWMLWVRPAQVHVVDWGGDPRNKELAAAEGPDVRLSPRKSFERWREVVRDHCDPWLPWQVEVADQVRSTVSHELVRRSREHVAVAESLQRSLVPTETPELADVELLARYRPAADIQLGGDWWDVFTLPDGRVAVAVGDVAGHGVDAAAAMAQVRTSLRAYAVDGHSPAETLDRLDRFVARMLPGQTATVVMAVIDNATGEIELANAGHPPPLIVRTDGATTQPPTGRPLLGAGIGQARTDRVHLAPGELMLLYTDGLVERRGVLLDESFDQLRAGVSDIPNDGPLESWIEGLLAAVPGTMDDDLTVVALRRTGLTTHDSDPSTTMDTP